MRRLLLIPQGINWIQPDCPRGWNETGRKPGDTERRDNEREDNGIPWVDAEQHRLQRTREHGCEANAEQHADPELQPPLPEHELHDASRLGPERHPDADLTRVRWVTENDITPYSPTTASASAAKPNTTNSVPKARKNHVSNSYCCSSERTQ